VDERGGDKNQICNGGKRTENEMRDNYRFIPPVRASHFRFVSKTVSIPEDLDHRHVEFLTWHSCRVKKILMKISRLRWASYWVS
jgi:hypothetical protein